MPKGLREEEGLRMNLDVSWKELEDKSKWVQWLALAKKESPDAYDWWTNAEVCHDCKHFEAENWWCKLQELPNSFNPYLTPKTGMIGLACMGGGHEVKNNP